MSEYLINFVENGDPNGGRRLGASKEPPFWPRAVTNRRGTANESNLMAFAPERFGLAQISRVQSAALRLRSACAFWDTSRALGQLPSAQSFHVAALDHPIDNGVTKKVPGACGAAVQGRLACISDARIIAGN